MNNDISFNFLAMNFIFINTKVHIANQDLIICMPKQIKVGLYIEARTSFLPVLVTPETESTVELFDYTRSTRRQI